MCTALQNYNGAVQLLNQPVFHTPMPLCGPRSSNQEMQGLMTLTAMQGVPHNLISGQGKICVNTLSHAMCNAGQSDHVGSTLLLLFKECHPRCVYQIYNRLIINNDSQKHNYICKYNNLPTTCFGLIRPSCANTVSATIPIFVNEILSPPSHLHLDQTDNFPQMLYSNPKMAELGRNM